MKIQYITWKIIFTYEGTKKLKIFKNFVTSIIQSIA